MGSIFDTWNDVVANGGGYYPGAGGGTTSEMIWLLISIAIVVGCLWHGNRHENDAYTKAGHNNVEP